MVPCIGALMVPLPAEPPAPVAPGRGRVLRWRAAGAAGPSGSQRRTEKRLPLTSTGTVRSTSSSASPSPRGAMPVATSGAGAAANTDASTSSSTHLVECVAAAKSGCESNATCAGVVVATPVTSSSPERAQHPGAARSRGRVPTRRACRAGCRSAGRRCRPRRSRRPSELPGPPGRRSRVMTPGEGRKPLAGSSALMRHLDRVAASLDRLLGEGERLTGRDAAVARRRDRATWSSR